MLQFSKIALSTLIAGTLMFSSCSNTDTQDNESVKFETSNQENKQLTFVELLERDTTLSYDEYLKIKEKHDNAKDRYLTDKKDYKSLLKVIEIYIYEARVTGEHPHYYSAALNSLNYMLSKRSELDQDQLFTALFYKATVQLSQHNFNEALLTGQEALALNEVNAGVYGVLVDANVEIGNYEQAVKMSDKMMSIRPDLRSYSRVSYMREIYGETEGSVLAMKQAITAGAPYSEYKCWAITTLGKLYEDQGQLDSAKLSYEFAITERKNYPFGIAGLASIEAKKGNTEEAYKLYEKAINILPEIGFNIELAQLKKENGATEEANKMIAEIETMFTEDIESGHNMNLEYAAFLHDFKNDNKKALELAKKELEARPNNIDVNKTLAFIYMSMNDKENAQKHTETALKTNKQDADLMCLHGILTNDNDMINKSFEINPFQSHAFVDEAKKTNA